MRETMIKNKTNMCQFLIFSLLLAIVLIFPLACANGDTERELRQVQERLIFASGSLEDASAYCRGRHLDDALAAIEYAKEEVDLAQIAIEDILRENY